AVQEPLWAEVLGIGEGVAGGLHEQDRWEHERAGGEAMTGEHGGGGQLAPYAVDDRTHSEGLVDDRVEVLVLAGVELLLEAPECGGVAGQALERPGHP